MKAILTHSDGRQEILTVNKVTNDDVMIKLFGRFTHYSFSGARLGKWGGSVLSPATEKGIAAIEARHKPEAEARRVETERKAKDPRTPLLARLSGDWHPWDTLSLEQLQAVIEIIDNPKGGAQ